VSNHVARELFLEVFHCELMLNNVAISTLPPSTHELYAQLLYVALQRLGLDAHAYLDDEERARSASKALAVLWLAIELAAADADKSTLQPARFERTRALPVLTQLRPLALGLSEEARQQLSALNGSGLLDVPPELWERSVPARGTDVMSTLALAWLAEAAVLGDELVVWLSDSSVLRRTIDGLAFLLEETLQDGSAMDAAHVPLSRSVVSEDERNALIDVWRAEQNPVFASGIVAKPVQRTAAAQPLLNDVRLAILERFARNKTPRQLLLLAGISLGLLLLLGMLLAR
jgi:hypothetical protein